uniref:CCDC113/CCDC96 coiled-coil domain-containing protein n=1 Tax=Glossina palpalis gambiensis TaxID=67801 RepID=A0A1B0C4Y4_9MUSC
MRRRPPPHIQEDSLYAKAMSVKGDNDDESSTTTLQSSTKSTSESVEEEEQESKTVLQDLYDSDEEPSDDEDKELAGYLLQEELVMEPDFFEMLGIIPNLDDISEDETAELSTVYATKELEEGEEGTRDTGTFVDPTTGAAIVNENIDQPEKEEQLEYQQAAPEVVEEEESAEIISDLDLVFMDEEEDVDLLKHADEEEALEIFLEMEVEKEAPHDIPIDWEALLLEEQKREQQIAIQFIDELINKVVNLAEFVTPENFLRQNLNKRKIMAEIKEKIFDLNIEEKVKSFLNRKVVEYYKRKKSFRPLLADNPKTLMAEKEKFSQALNRLDFLLDKESKTLNKKNCTVKELESEITESRAKATQEIDDFEHLVKKTVGRDSRPRLNSLIDNELRKMSRVRKEINQVRFKMLTKQHTEVWLQKKLSEFATPHTAINIKELENMIISINHELTKLRVRCRADIHDMAHYKERQKMLTNTIVNQKLALEELEEEKRLCRNRLFDLKSQRTRIRTEMQNISFQTCMLGRPTLMLDYDETVKIINTKRDEVTKLRMRFHNLQEEVHKIENRCPIDPSTAVIRFSVSSTIQILQRATKQQA